MSDRCILNFDSKAIRDNAKRHIDAMRGPCEWFCRKLKGQRSLNQNAYYYGVVAPYVAKGIREAWGDKEFDADMAHVFCADKFLKRPVVNHNTGEVTGWIILSTASLDKAQFSEYVDKIKLFAAEYLNTEIPEADKYHREVAA